MNSITKDYTPGVQSGVQSSRRSFLSFLIGLFSLGFIAGAGKILFQYIWPPKKLTGLESEGGNKVLNIPLSEIEVNSSKKVRFAGGTYIVIRTESGVFALSAVCTHLGCLVNWEADAHEIVCPCHAARFDINGNVIGGPAPKPLQQIKATIVNGNIEIKEG
jgi:cytochrome b6-f complex iron-sulfur subunit